VESLIHYDVASISKTVVLPLYEQEACSAVRRCQNSFHTHTAFVRNVSHTELLHVFSKRSSMYMHLYKHVGGHFYHLL